MQTLGDYVPYMGFSPTGDVGDLTVYTTKQRRVVFFLKAPPLVPPTAWQKRQRTRFKNCATLWWQLTQEKRNAWLFAAKAATLYCTGYNLFVHWQLRRDEANIRTIERITRQILL